MGKYSLGARTLEAVTLTDQQTLVEGTIEQNETHTVLTFVKLLEEPGEIAIDPNGENHFLVAAGSDNELAYHDKRETLPFQLSVCGTINVAEPTDPTQAPSATSETPAPAPQEEPTGPIDCTQFQSFHTYEGTGLTLSYVVLLDEESGEGNISARVEYEGTEKVQYRIEISFINIMTLF